MSTLKPDMCWTCGSVKILFVIDFYNPETLLNGPQATSLAQTDPTV